MESTLIDSAIAGLVGGGAVSLSTLAFLAFKAGRVTEKIATLVRRVENVESEVDDLQKIHMK